MMCQALGGACEVMLTVCECEDLLRHTAVIRRRTKTTQDTRGQEDAGHICHGLSVAVLFSLWLVRGM